MAERDPDRENAPGASPLTDGGMPSGLTKNESLVWKTLSGSDDPLKAYEILDELKTKGVRAPMTVYRALDGLEEKGLIHKLEAMNAFLVCNHEGPHQIQMFLVCDGCQRVEEVGADGLEFHAMPVLRRRDFKVRTARLEIKGHCTDCGQAAPAS